MDEDEEDYLEGDEVDTFIPGLEEVELFTPNLPKEPMEIEVLDEWWGLHFITERG